MKHQVDRKCTTEMLELLEDYWPCQSDNIGQSHDLRKKRWETVWDVLQVLRMMVSELRPEAR